MPVVEGRKEMFYLMMHSTHFIYGYMVSHMVKDHSNSERENLLLPLHGLLFLISIKCYFICTILIMLMIMMMMIAHPPPPQKKRVKYLK